MTWPDVVSEPVATVLRRWKMKYYSTVEKMTPVIEK